MNKNNRKAAYTKSVLQDALEDMLSSQTYSNISVLMLCQAAKVSRASFYRNFRNKDDLLASIISRIIDQVMEDSDKRISPDLFSSVWLDRQHLIRALDESNLFALFNTMLTKKIRSIFPEGSAYDYISAVIAWNTGAILSVWAAHDFMDDKTMVAEAGYSAIAEIEAKMLK